RSPEPPTAIFRAPRFLLAPRRNHKLAGARTRPLLPSRRDELDAFAAHETEAFDFQSERRELARRGIACTRRPEPAEHEGHDPEQAAGPGPGLVVVDEDHRRPSREPPPERRHERVPLRGGGTGTEEGKDRGGSRLVGTGERHARAERGRQTATVGTEHGDATLERSQQLE